MNIKTVTERKIQRIQMKFQDFLQEKLPLIVKKIPDNILISPDMVVKIKFIRYVNQSVVVQIIVEEKNIFYNISEIEIANCSFNLQYQLMKISSEVLKYMGFSTVRFNEKNVMDSLYNFDVIGYVSHKRFKLYTL